MKFWKLIMDYNQSQILKHINYKEEKVFGRGISHPDEDNPTFSKFGNPVILLKDIFIKNILSLKTKTGHTIDGLKTRK